MAIVNRHVDTGGLGMYNLSAVQTVQISKINATFDSANTSAGVGKFWIAPAAAAANNVFTKQSMATTLHSTSAAGTQLDFARNLSYRMSVTAVSNSLSAFDNGTIVITGRLPDWNSVSESVALSRIVAAGTDGVEGTQCFFTIGAVSFSAVTQNSAFSSASGSVSLSVGGGGRLMLPQSIHHTSAAIPIAYLAGAVKTTTGVVSATSNNEFTVYTGRYGQAAIKYSDALSSNAIPWFPLINLQKSNA